MSADILRWLGGHDTGASSKAIALTALGEMPRNPSYPRDGADLGRCLRLIKQCPDAIQGVRRLGESGGDVWKALAARWDELTAAAATKEGAGDLVRSIVRPIEDASGSVVRLGGGITVRLPEGLSAPNAGRKA